MSERLPKVQGRCPHGCGNTLFLGEGGYVTCSLLGCPAPASVSAILEALEYFIAEHDSIEEAREMLARASR